MKGILFLTLVSLCSISAYSQVGWTNQPSGTTERFRSIVFTDTVVGYAAGFSGAIVKTTSEGEPTATGSIIFQNRDIKIYPNPNNGIFSIILDNPNNSKALITIQNTNGEKILDKIVQQNIYTFDTSNLINGVYLIKVEIENEIFIKKWIKI